MYIDQDFILLVVFLSLSLSVGSVVLYPFAKPVAMKMTHNHISKLTYPYPPHLIPEGKKVHKRV